MAYSYRAIKRSIGVIQGVFKPRRVFMLAIKNETNVVLAVDTSTDMLACTVARLTRCDAAAAAADGGFDVEVLASRKRLTPLV